MATDKYDNAKDILDSFGVTKNTELTGNQIDEVFSDLDISEKAKSELLSGLTPQQYGQVVQSLCKLCEELAKQKKKSQAVALRSLEKSLDNYWDAFKNTKDETQRILFEKRINDTLNKIYKISREDHIGFWVAFSISLTLILSGVAAAWWYHTHNSNQ